MQPSEPLFAIPSTALINTTTLAARYSSSGSLTPTQLISLHLFLARPEGELDSKDVTFGPFISILPREFDSHPLTWVVRRETNDGGSQLLDILPPNITLALTAVRNRFWTDWSTISKYMVCEPFWVQSYKLILLQDEHGLSDLRTVMDYLWAWLNGLNTLPFALT